MNDPQEPATAPEPTHGLPQSLTEAALWLRSDKVSCYELTRGYLARIEAAEPNLNAFITVMADQALAAARARDEHRAAGKALGPARRAAGRQGHLRHRRRAHHGRRKDL